MDAQRFEAVRTALALHGATLERHRDGLMQIHYKHGGLDYGLSLRQAQQIADRLAARRNAAEGACHAKP